jgi:hypothetical protein
MDRELLHLARDDGAARLVLGRLANRFRQMCGWERLCFARLDDYAAERIGWSGRQLEQLALVARRLACLPRTEAAFRSGSLSWSKVRLLTSIASASDEAGWLAVAAVTDVRTLTAVTANARAAMREQRSLTGAPSIGSTGSESASAEDDEENSEERVRVRVLCTRRAARKWAEIRRLAPRLAGRALAAWQVAELVAAEASSTKAPFEELWRHEPWRTLASNELDGGLQPPLPHGSPPDVAAGGVCSADRPSDDEAIGPSVVDSHEALKDIQPASPFEQELERLEELDVNELDAAMRRVRRDMQQRQSRLGVMLGQFLDLRLEVELGYACSSEYVRERLGMAERTARELIRVANAVQSRSPLLASAYADGKLSWLRALTLLPVVRTCNAAAWVERANEVTLRRLADEVDWVMGRVDLVPANAAAMPPPRDEKLIHEDERQLCASESRDEDLWGVTGRIHVSFVAPLSISSLFRSVMQGFAAPSEPRWKAIERMLEHVLAQWHSFPKHRNPVFARDGYRCTAPGCGSFTNLHDHHIVPRSLGGSDELSNRTTLCAWHHLRAVHGGLARLRGEAPDNLQWEMGIFEGRPPVMHLHGERYIDGPVHPDTTNVIAGEATGAAGEG